jgi:adenylyl-sulfate kinase
MSIKPPYTIWLMGPTSSGKTTIAESFVSILKKNKIHIIHYDGDEIRDLFGKGYGFNESNRRQIIETLVHLSNKVNDIEIPVIVSALTAHKSARDYIKMNIPKLFSVYIKCPIEVCAERDPKGLYKKAKNGEINTLIGYNSDYIPPIKPDITLDTKLSTVEESVNKLIKFFDLKTS